MPVYTDDDSTRYLANLAALQMTAGDPAAAHESRIALDKRVLSKEGRSPTGRAIVYAIYVQARMTEAEEHVSFASAFKQEFRATFEHLDDLAADDLEGWFLHRPSRCAKPSSASSTSSATSMRSRSSRRSTWFERGLAFEAYSSIEGLVRPLLTAEKERRYVVDEEVAIPVADGATIAATIVRPRAATENGKVATVLEFTLDRSSRDPREAAAHGYASVLALARIAGDLATRPRAPFESDGDDARAVIDWIAQQPWSDGRVGMQGTGYGGFVAWAVAKQLPPALKAIATSDPMAPGIDIPMRGRIVLSSAYRWVYDMLAPPGDAAANDAAHWRKLDEDWYRSGRSYREFPTLPGPGQRCLPPLVELSELRPVLAEVAAVRCGVREDRHTGAHRHGLLLGRTDRRALLLHRAPQVRPECESRIADRSFRRANRRERRFAVGSRAGFRTTSRASTQTPRDTNGSLTRSKAPTKTSALIRDNVNYELAGANEWRHVASLRGARAETHALLSRGLAGRNGQRARAGKTARRRRL